MMSKSDWAGAIMLFVVIPGFMALGVLAALYSWAGWEGFIIIGSIFVLAWLGLGILDVLDDNKDYQT